MHASHHFQAYAYANMSYKIPGEVHNYYINSGNGREWMIPTEVGRMLGTQPWYRYKGVTSPLNKAAVQELKKMKKICKSIPGSIFV